MFVDEGEEREGAGEEFVAGGAGLAVCFYFIETGEHLHPVEAVLFGISDKVVHYLAHRGYVVEVVRTKVLPVEVFEGVRKLLVVFILTQKSEYGGGKFLDKAHYVVSLQHVFIYVIVISQI